MLVYGEDEALAEWLARQLSMRFSPPYTCIGVTRGDALVAAVLYNNYQPPDIQMTIASTTPRWATRQVIARLLAYPFNELRCLRVTAVTRSMNQPARAFLCRLGFVPEGFHPSLYVDDAGVSYGLLKNDARKWLEGFDEQGPERSAAREPDASGGSADPE